MAKGLPKNIIKKYGISKKAWAVFRGARAKRKANKPRHSYVRKRTYKLPRRRSLRRRARGFLTFNTIAKFIKIGALAAPAIDIYADEGGGLRGATTALMAYAGYNRGMKGFDFALLARAWTPYVMTSLVTTGVSKLNGIIRRL